MPKAGSSRVRETLKICSIVAVTAIVVALAVPAAVDAAGSFVTIEDADSTNRAQVDNGKLRIGDGNGNPNSLTVNGTVTARPQWVSEYRRFYAFAGGDGTCVPLATAPTGKAVVLQSLAFSVFDNPSPGLLDYFVVYASPDCAAELFTFITPPGLGLIDVPLEPGIVSTTGFAIRITGEPRADVYGVGYLIPASSAPPASPTPEAAPEDPRTGR